MEFCITYLGDLIFNKESNRWERLRDTYKTGHDTDYLFDLIQLAWNQGKEIQISIGQYDPTPEHLYDTWGGEPPMTMDEIYSAAHAQHIALHS